MGRHVRAEICDQNSAGISKQLLSAFQDGGVPTWFQLGRGKDLHDNVKAKFDAGRDGDRAFSNLTDIGDILTKNIPGFIPRSLANLFKDLQSASSAEAAPVSRSAPLPAAN